MRPVLLVLAMVVAACSSSGGADSPESTSTPLGVLSQSTPDATESEAPAAEPEATAKPLSVKVTKRTKSGRVDTEFTVK